MSATTDGRKEKNGSGEEERESAALKVSLHLCGSYTGVGRTTAILPSADEWIEKGTRHERAAASQQVEGWRHVVSTHAQRARWVVQWLGCLLLGAYRKA